MLLKNIPPILVILFLLSCKTTVQVISVQSKNVKFDDYYVFENDSIKITYDLWAHYGVTNFSIYNKLNKPLYIDWKKCSFISNENKFDYYIDVERSEQISYYGSYLYRGWLGDVQSGKSASTQTKIKPERITFIPPKSFIYNSKFRIKPGHSYRMTNAIEEEVSISWKNSSSKKTKVKRINLSQNTSKDIFRNFLTFSYSEKFDTEFYIDNNFWVSQVLEMSEKQFVGRKRFEGQKSSCPYNTANGFYIYVDSEPGYFFCN